MIDHVRPANNFGFLRLLFAIFVVVTHSFILTGAGRDVLDRLTGDQLSFAYLGLSGFFVISGYLVMQSLQRSESIIHYYQKRILRVFPGLFVVLLLSVLLGYFVSGSTWTHYISDSSVWTYLPANLSLIKYQGTMDGVFAGNPFSAEVNGSLWSLFYEVAFYIALSFLFFLSQPHQGWAVGIILFVLLTSRVFFFAEFSGYNYLLESRRVLEFGPFFFAGSVLASLTLENMKWQTLWLSAATILLVLLTAAHWIDLTKYFVFPFVVILFGLQSFGILSSVTARIGDLSYGIYIYGFPVQQTLLYFFDLSAPVLLITSLPIVVVFGYFSLHLVEKRFLRRREKSEGR